MGVGVNRSSSQFQSSVLVDFTITVLYKKNGIEGQFPDFYES
jgi:hypothetical protein